MSTVLVFNPVSDLAGAQTATDAITLTWTNATPILTLVNLGFELGNVGGNANGPPIGWQTIAGGMRVRVNESQRESPEGLNSTDGGNFVLSQSSQRFSPLTEGLTIDQIDNDALEITVTWWGGAFIQSPIDQPQLHIEFLDDTLSSLGTSSSGYKTPTTTVGVMRWNEYQQIAEIPVGTRFIDIILDANRNNGIQNDAAFDDIRVALEDAEDAPHVPGYAIYQDDVLVATAPANAESYVVSGLSTGTYTFKVVAYDGTNFLSTDSNEAEATVAELADNETNAIFPFNDERVFVGYLGGRLNGRTVACTGRNANTVKDCCK